MLPPSLLSSVKSGDCSPVTGPDALALPILKAVKATAAIEATPKTRMLLNIFLIDFAVDEVIICPVIKRRMLCLA